ncbi:hypothetical protein WJU23_17690 [Prosthecobacter sp. SYSU 5D2]|uniref:hypothetical protein n=1 Tax=Prosthecobacter sp. SYSU 5D2 TaxID=3134134 RepID=UPI0031FF35A2
MHRTSELSHGRYEEREVLACAVNNKWFPKNFLWYGLRSALYVIRRSMRLGHDGENSDP